MIPPWWLRRLVLAPAVPVLTLLVLTSLPLTALVAAFVSRWIPGRWRPLRLLWLLLVYLVVESATLLALFALWIAAGFGRRTRRERWQRAHYTLMRWYLGVLVRSAQRRFNLRFEIELEDAARGAQHVSRRRASAGEASAPLVVLSRHAGPGDSFLLVHGLLQLGYRPRIVLKETLRWAPAIDVVLQRVPSAFIGRGRPPGTGTAAIAALARGMEVGDALVIFPEGRNFTPGRRGHSIAKLEELGDHDAAEDAREFRHVLMPRSGGALAALAMSPSADVVFVSHAGLEDLSGVVDLWRGLPMDAAVAVKIWRVGRGQVPRQRVAQEAWLAWWWRRIDAWLVDHHGEEAVPDLVVDAVAEVRGELEDLEEVPLGARGLVVPQPEPERSDPEAERPGPDAERG